MDIHSLISKLPKGDKKQGIEWWEPEVEDTSFFFFLSFGGSIVYVYVFVFISAQDTIKTPE